MRSSTTPTNFDNFALKRWLRRVGAFRRHELLHQLRNDLQRLGSSKRSVCRGLIQLATRPCVILHRDKVTAYHRSKNSPVGKGTGNINILDDNLKLAQSKNDLRKVTVDLDKTNEKFGEIVERNLQKSREIPEKTVHSFETEMLMLDDAMVSKIPRTLEKHKTHRNYNFYDLINSWQKSSRNFPSQVHHSNKTKETSETHSRIKHTSRSTNLPNAVKEGKVSSKKKQGLNSSVISAELRKYPKDEHVIKNENLTKKGKKKLRTKFREYFGNFVSLSEDEQEENILKNRNRKRKKENCIDLNYVQIVKKIQRALPDSTMQEMKENAIPTFRTKVENREGKKFKANTFEMFNVNNEASMKCKMLETIDDQPSLSDEVEQNVNCVSNVDAKNERYSHNVQDEHNCSISNAEKNRNLSIFDTSISQNSLDKEEISSYFTVEIKNMSDLNVDKNKTHVSETNEIQDVAAFDADKIKNVSALTADKLKHITGINVDKSEVDMCNISRAVISMPDLDILNIVVEDDPINSEESNTSAASKNEDFLAVDSKEDLLNLLHMNFDASCEFTTIGNHVSIKQSNEEKTTLEKSFNHVSENPKTHFSSSLDEEQKLIPCNKMEQNGETSTFDRVNAEKAERSYEDPKNLQCKQRLRVLSSAELGSTWHLIPESQGISSGTVDATRIEANQDRPPSGNDEISMATQSLQNSQKMSTINQLLEDQQSNSNSKLYQGYKPKYNSYFSKTGLELECPDVQFDNLPKSDMETINCKKMQNLRIANDFTKTQRIENEMNSLNNRKPDMDIVNSRTKNVGSFVQQNIDPSYSKKNCGDLPNFVPTVIHQPHIPTHCNDLYPRITAVEKLNEIENSGMKYQQNSVQLNLNPSYCNNNYGNLVNFLPAQIHQTQVQTHCSNPHQRVTAVKDVIGAQNARIESLQSAVQPNLDLLSANIDYGDLSNCLPTQIHQTHGQSHCIDPYLQIIAVENIIRAQNAEIKNPQSSVYQNMNPNYLNKNYGNISNFLPTQNYHTNINTYCNDPYPRNTSVEKIIEAQNSRITNLQITMQPNLNQVYPSNNYGCLPSFLPTQIHQTNVHAQCADCYPRMIAVEKVIPTQNRRTKNPRILNKKRTASSLSLSAKNKVQKATPQEVSRQENINTKSNYDHLKCFTGIQKLMLLKQLDFYLESCSNVSHNSTKMQSQRFVLIGFRKSLLNYQQDTLTRYNAEQKRRERIPSATSRPSTLKNLQETSKNITQKPYKKSVEFGQKLLVDSQKELTSIDTTLNFVEEKNVSSRSTIITDGKNPSKNGSGITKESLKYDSPILQGVDTLPEQLNAVDSSRRLQVKKLINTVENEISSPTQMVTIEILDSDRIKVVASDEKTGVQIDKNCNFERNMSDVNLCDNKEVINVPCERSNYEKRETSNLNTEVEMLVGQNCKIDENNISVEKSNKLESISTEDEKECINIEDVRSIPLDVFQNINEDEDEKKRVDLDRKFVFKAEIEDDEKKICLQCCEISTVVCGNCFEAHYCSQKCASMHWNSVHHSLCKRILPDALSCLSHLNEL